MTTTLHILQHALGRDQYGRPNPTNPDYRNYFVTGPGSNDFALCVQAVADGLMTRRAGNQITGGDDLFRVTGAGVIYIDANSPKPPVLTRGQKRYREWLRGPSDWCTFGEFIGGRSRAERRAAEMSY